MSAVIPLGLVPTAEGDIEGRRRIIVDVLGWEWCEEHGAARRRGYNSCAALHTDRRPPHDWPGIRRQPVWAKTGESSLSLDRPQGVQSIRSRYAYIFIRKVLVGDFVQIGKEWIGPVVAVEYVDQKCLVWLSGSADGEPDLTLDNYRPTRVRRLKRAHRASTSLTSSKENQS